MKILIIDTDAVGLNYALRCQWAGHEVRMFQPPKETGSIGEGLVAKVKDWRPSMEWAELIVVTNNYMYAAELEEYFLAGYPIAGTNRASAELEHDRSVGQQVLEDCGIETLPFEEFSNYDKAIAFVKREDKVYVSKPFGSGSDRALSYVPDTPEDLVCRLERWKKEGLKGKFILQEKVGGKCAEMAAGTWFGPGGFSRWINETFEEKRFMNDGYGPNTGEMGTVLRYTKQSKLFEQVCRPLETALHRLGFVGNVDVSCMIDAHGRPWPMEFTMRFGWPAFNLMLSLHDGDPAQWLMDLLQSRDTLKCSTKLCCGVVMTIGDYPWSKLPHDHVSDWPIRGLSAGVLEDVALTSVKTGRAPGRMGGRIQDINTLVTAGDYVLVAMGQGTTVEQASKRAYTTVDKISWPPHTNLRTDIGKRLEKDLGHLHKHGYAMDITYGN